MTTKQMLMIYLITLAVFFLIDMVWLGVVAKDLRIRSSFSAALVE
ncbi:MAG: hypothetical protein WAU81_01560 [Candidatus Aminicenantales bacterium]